MEAPTAPHCVFGLSSNCDFQVVSAILFHIQFWSNSVFSLMLSFAQKNAIATALCSVRKLSKEDKGDFLRHANEQMTAHAEARWIKSISRYRIPIYFCCLRKHADYSLHFPRVRAPTRQHVQSSRNRLISLDLRLWYNWQFDSEADRRGDGVWGRVRVVQESWVAYQWYVTWPHVLHKIYLWDTPRVET